MKVCLFSLLLMLLVAAPVYSQPASPESIKELMQKTGAGNMSVQMMNQMLPALKRMVPNAPAEFWDEFASEMDGSEIENMLIPVYQKHFSVEEIKSINAFYDTPAGKKLISSQPAIMQESMMIGQQWGRDLARKVIEKYKAQNPK